jgi:peptidyl-prolyl cis-trans isomerase D
MLRGIRKASENWLGRAAMGVVMSLLAGSFAIWGINDIFRGFGRSTLAKIGGIEIPIEQFRQSYQDRLEQISRQIGHPLPPDQASALGLDHQVLSELIAQAGLDQRARQMGLGLSDDEIARRITSDPNLQTSHGEFDRARFDDVLRNMGLTEQRFIADQRQTALRRQIIDSVAGDMTPPKAWLDAINQYQNEQRSVEFVALGPAQAGTIPQPTADQLEKYFDQRKTLFRAPEYRKIDTVTVTPAELAKWMEISDDDLKKAYDARRTSFTTLERRHIEQILFPNMADAQAAADRIKSGTSFAAIAAERGLKQQDIDLGTVAKSGIVDAAVADAAFSLKAGEVSAPVQGQFGAALLTAVEIDPEVTKSLTEVTPQLRNDIALERAKSQVADIHDRIEDDRAGGMTLEQAADKEKLAVVTYDAVSRAGLDPDGRPVVNLPRGGEVINAAFASDVGVDNDPIEADGGDVWYDVAAITPAHDRTLDEVKDAVEQRWRADETASRLKTKADDLLDKLKSGTPFDALAASSGLKIETASDFKRGGAVPGLAPKMIDAVFHTAKDAFGGGEGNNPTQWIVFRVTDVKTPVPDANATDAKSMQQTVQRQLSDDVIGQYVAWLESDLGTTVNAEVLAQAMGQNNAPDTN